MTIRVTYESRKRRVHLAKGDEELFTLLAAWNRDAHPHVQAYIAEVLFELATGDQQEGLSVIRTWVKQVEAGVMVNADRNGYSNLQYQYRVSRLKIRMGQLTKSRCDRRR